MHVGSRVIMSSSRPYFSDMESFFTVVIPNNVSTSDRCFLIQAYLEETCLVGLQKNFPPNSESKIEKLPISIYRAYLEAVCPSVRPSNHLQYLPQL